MNKFLMIVGACVLAACNPQKDNNPITNTAESLKDVHLVGKHFFGPCVGSELGAQAQGLQMKVISYKFEGANVTRMTQYYNSNDCKSAAAYNTQEIGQIKIMTDKQTPDGGRFIDMNFNELSVEIISQEGAQAANGFLNLCGLKDWAPGQKRNMTQAAPQAKCLNRELGLERQIYRVEGDVLTLGNLGVAGMSARDQEGRPTQLDRNGMRFTAGK